MNTLDGLERHEGHFLNWYDTRSLAPLQPRYVSTVDSANLAGALMTLAAGLRRLEPMPRPGIRRTVAIADTLALLRSSLGTLPGADTAETIRTRLAPVLREVEALEVDRVAVRTRGAAVGDRLAQALEAESLGERADPEGRDAAFWGDALVRLLGNPDGSSPGDEAPAAGRPGGARRDARRRHGLPVPVRPEPPHLLHRLPARRRGGPRTPRRLVLRPPRVGGSARELRRHREGRRSAGTLVPARPRARGRRRRAHARLLERVDVRVPDAAPGDGTTRTRCCIGRRNRRSRRRSSTAGCAAFPGGSPSRRTTRWTGTGTTSTRPSAFPSWD